MSALSAAAEDYLRLRRSLGHELAEAHRLLPRFVAYLDAVGATTVTVEDGVARLQPAQDLVAGAGPGTYMCFTIRSYNAYGYSAWTPYACTSTF